MSEEFSPGVKIVLERIRDFPDDFIGHRTLSIGHSSWANMAQQIMREQDTFTDKERKAVRDTLRDARRKEFDGEVMDLLAGKPEPEPQLVENKKMLISRAQLDIMQKMTNVEFNKAYTASLATGLGIAVQKQEGNSI
jgi:hypothetical protein